MLPTWVIALVAGLAGFGLGIGATVVWFTFFGLTLAADAIDAADKEDYPTD